MVFLFARHRKTPEEKSDCIEYSGNIAQMCFRFTVYFI